jgi:hypothetical protein
MEKKHRTWNPFIRSEPTCLHIWGRVENGYQYCTKCGLARTAGCIHEWEIEQQYTVSREKKHIGDIIYYKCKKCSQRKYVRTDLYEKPIVKML